MKYIYTAILSAFLATSAQAEVPKTIFERTFSASNPEGIELLDTNIISQDPSNTSTYISRVDFKIGGDENLYYNENMIYGTTVLSSFDDRGNITVQTNVRSIFENGEWKPVQFSILNKEEVIAYLEGAKTLKNWPEDSVIKNSEDYKILVEKSIQLEKTHFKDLPYQLTGTSTCRHNGNWDLSLTWNINRIKIGALQTKLTLTDKLNGDVISFDGEGYYDENKNLSFKHLRTIEKLLGFDGRRWPSIVELEKQNNIWIGETIIPDTSVCDVKMESTNTLNSFQEKEKALFDEAEKNLFQHEYLTASCGEISEKGFSLKRGQQYGEYSADIQGSNLKLNFQIENSGNIFLNTQSLLRQSSYSKEIINGFVQTDKISFETKESCKIEIYTREGFENYKAPFIQQRDNFLEKAENKETLDFKLEGKRNFGETYFVIENVINTETEQSITGTVKGLIISGQPASYDMKINLNNPTQPEFEGFNIPAKKKCDWNGILENNQITFDNKSRNSGCADIHITY